MNWKKIKKKILTIGGTSAVGIAVSASQAFATTTDMTSTITDWLPIILQFAMLGMVFGLIKKFGGR